MIIQNELVPAEACKEKLAMESNKYLVMNNHVREIDETETNHCENSQEQSKEGRLNSRKEKKRKKQKREHSSSDNDPGNQSNTNEISESDLQELKRVYKKCKSVLLKIESKYGHLLDLNEEDSITRKRKLNNESDKECNCILKSKVIFNEDGEVVQSVESLPDYHICHDRLQTYRRYQPTQTLQTENESFAIPLPDTIEELENMLRDPVTSILRKRVLDKIRFIRQVNQNMIRNDKKDLIAKLKENPDEIIDFKGANISSIVGYPSECM